MIEARLGPTSVISRKKSRKAIAVQTRPSTTSEASTSVLGICVGSPAAAGGRSRSVAMPRAPATGPIGSAAAKWRLTSIGPAA